MIKIYSNANKKYVENISVLEKMAKKFNLEKESIQFASYEKFIFSYLYCMAISNKTLYLVSDENHHKPQAIPLSKVKNIVIEKKVDLNIWFQDGSKINLTSVVGAKPSVITMVRFLNEEVNRCRKI